MWLIVGLGNPGASYAQHRHNVGFMAADVLAQHYSFPAYSKKFSGDITSGLIGSEKCQLLKPLTFMNKSGQSVGEACRYFDIPPEKVLVIHDELDLLFGKIRIKKGGGHGGHNGLRDIDAHIGKDYWRLRFGIGHPGHKDRVHGYVLSNFAKAEQDDVHQLCDIIAAECPLLFTQGHEALMSRIAYRSPVSTPNEKEAT